MKPYAEQSGNGHFPKGWRIAKSECLHCFSDETPERISDSTPSEPEQTADKKSVAVAVQRIVQVEDHDKKRLDIDDDVRPDEDRQVDISPQWERHGGMGAKVKRSKRHLRAPCLPKLLVAAYCLHQVSFAPDLAPEDTRLRTLWTFCPFDFSAGIYTALRVTGLTCLSIERFRPDRHSSLVDLRRLAFSEQVLGKRTGYTDLLILGMNSGERVSPDSIFSSSSFIRPVI